jgi:hypothetical protein
VALLRQPPGIAQQVRHGVDLALGWNGVARIVRALRGRGGLFRRGRPRGRGRLGTRRIVGVED